MDRNRLNEMIGMTEEQLDEVASAFEAGNWDREEYGKPSIGRPAIFEEAMRPVTFKETPSVIAATDEFATALGASR